MILDGNGFSSGGHYYFSKDSNCSDAYIYPEAKFWNRSVYNDKFELEFEQWMNQDSNNIYFCYKKTLNSVPKKLPNNPAFRFILDPNFDDSCWYHGNFFTSFYMQQNIDISILNSTGPSIDFGLDKSYTNYIHSAKLIFASNFYICIAADIGPDILSFYGTSPVIYGKNITSSGLYYLEGAEFHGNAVCDDFIDFIPESAELNVQEI